MDSRRFLARTGIPPYLDAAVGSGSECHRANVARRGGMVCGSRAPLLSGADAFLSMDVRRHGAEAHARLAVRNRLRGDGPGFPDGEMDDRGKRGSLILGAGATN